MRPDEGHGLQPFQPHIGPARHEPAAYGDVMSTPLCDARKTDGSGTCQHQAGWGTDHPGHGRCKFHGGASPSGRKHARTQQARQAVDRYGLPREIDPHDALLEEVHRAAGAVSWLGQIVAVLHDDKGDLVESTMFGEQPSVWLKLYQQEREQLRRVAKTAIDAGIAERQVRLAEQQGELIAQVIRGVLEDLGVADRPEVPQIVRRRLELVAS